MRMDDPRHTLDDPSNGREKLLSLVTEKLRKLKLEVSAFRNPDGSLSLEKLCRHFNQFDFFRQVFQEDPGFEIAERNRWYLIVGCDISSGIEREKGRIWLDRGEFEEKIREIREASPKTEPQAAKELLITGLIDRVRQGDTATVGVSTERIAPARSEVNEIYVVKVAKRAKQFELFAETYARNAVLRAKGIEEETAPHVAAAENAWRQAKSAAEKAAQSAIAAVKSGEVTEAVQAAALQAEAELRCSADAAQSALDAANRIVRAVDGNEVTVTPLDADVAPFFEKIRQCLDDTNKAAERAELFAGYARTYIQMADVKSLSEGREDVGRQALFFAETAAKAAAQAMMAADEARVCAEKAGFRKFFAVEEKKRLDCLLEDADRRAKAALVVAVEAAAGTGAEVLRESGR